MNSVIAYLIALVLGYTYGSYLRKKRRKKLSYSSMIQTALVYANVIFMGIRIGLNDTIIKNFFTIGMSSILFAAAVMLFAILITSIGRKLLGFDRLGDRHKDVNYLFVKEKVEFFKKKEEEKRKITLNNMTINILLFALVGILVGYFLIYENVKKGLLFNGNIEGFENVLSIFVILSIAILIYFVGIDLGFDESTIKHIKETGLIILVFPLLNIIGTTIGALIVTFILKMNLYEGLACGEGYAWFSLAPNLILNFGLVECAAISFLTNVLREVFAFIFIPIVANYVGYIESICLAGAASMDDCLPVVAKCTTPVVAIYCFVSGTVLTIFVPFVVTFFASLA